MERLLRFKRKDDDANIQYKKKQFRSLLQMRKPILGTKVVPHEIRCKMNNQIFVLKVPFLKAMKIK